MNLKKELVSLIDGEVKDDSETLTKYSRDASAFEVRPKIIVYPKNVEDLKKLVRFVTAHKKDDPEVSLTVRAGGSDMSGGTLNNSIIVDVTKYLNRIGEVDSQKRVVTVEPGAYWRDFEKVTLEKNLLMPIYPASKDMCAIGGMVANNAGGEKTLSYGKVEDFVLSLKAILADGQEYSFGPLSAEELQIKMSDPSAEGALYRNMYTLIESNKADIDAAKPNVSKNSAGYYLWNIWNKDMTQFNLAKLIVGSQGTLGIITEATLRLVRPKKHSKMVVIFLKDLSVLADLVNTVLPHKPESFESYDDKTLWLVFRYFPGFVKIMGVKNIFKLGLSFLPEAKIVITKGIPKLILIAEFTGDDKKEVNARAKEALESLQVFDVGLYLVKDAQEAEKYWTIRRQAFNLIRNHLKKEKSVPFIDDVIVRPEKLPEFFPKLYSILDPYKDRMRYALGGHSGDGNFHIYTILDMHKPEVRELIPLVTQKIYDVVLEMGGSITAEHNDGLIRSPFLSRMYGENIVHLFEQTKDIFDPQNIFNPGKKVRASWEYAVSHIRTNS